MPNVVHVQSDDVVDPVDAALNWMLGRMADRTEDEERRERMEFGVEQVRHVLGSEPRQGSQSSVTVTSGTGLRNTKPTWRVNGILNAVDGSSSASGNPCSMRTCPARFRDCGKPSTSSTSVRRSGSIKNLLMQPETNWKVLIAGLMASRSHIALGRPSNRLRKHEVVTNQRLLLAPI